MADNVLVIGIGNQFRRDDGVGLEVARRIQALQLPNLLVVESAGDVSELLDLWSRAQQVVVVDAVYSGAAPGTIFRFDTQRETIPNVFGSRVSTHGVGLAEAVELAGVIGSLPEELIIYGIQGSDFGTGAGLSEQMQGAIDSVVSELLAEIRRLQPVIKEPAHA